LSKIAFVEAGQQGTTAKRGLKEGPVEMQKRNSSRSAEAPIGGKERKKSDDPQKIAGSPVLDPQKIAGSQRSSFES
jgi:hypothetical protein